MKKVSQVKIGTVARFRLDMFQRAALGLLLILTILTFVGSQVYSRLWQSSQWLVGTVLPAVVVSLTNEERVAEDKKPLQRSDTLDTAARLKAEHMADNQYFAHYAPDGTTPWSFFEAAGYVYAHAGENLAIHFTDSTDVVDAWMKSPKHRDNIVGSQYTQIGVGTAKGEYEGKPTVYVVQLFGAPGMSTPAEVPAQNTVASAPTNTRPRGVEVATDRSDLEETIVSPIVAEVESDTRTSQADEQVVAEVEGAAVGSDTMSTMVIESAPVTEQNNDVADDEIVIVETSLIATSSGLAIATVTETPPQSAPTAALATQPQTFVQFAYLALAGMVVALAVISLVYEAKQRRFIQVGYSAALLCLIAFLWTIQTVVSSTLLIV